MTDYKTTLRVDASLHGAVQEISRQTAAEKGIPHLTNASVYRRLVEVGLRQVLDGEVSLGDLLGVAEEADDDPLAAVSDAAHGAETDLRELIDVYERILFERERYVEGEAQVRNLITGFEKRVRDHFRSRFEGGMRPDQLRKFAVNMRTDADLLLPDDLAHEEGSTFGTEEEVRARRRECKDYVDALLSAALDAMAQSDRDPLDPEEVFAHHQGVEEGRESDVVDAHAVEIATEVADRLDRVGGTANPDDLVRSVAKKYGVGEAQVWDLVRSIRGDGGDLSTLTGETGLSPALDGEAPVDRTTGSAPEKAGKDD